MRISLLILRLQTNLIRQQWMQKVMSTSMLNVNISTMKLMVSLPLKRQV